MWGSGAFLTSNYSLHSTRVTIFVLHDWRSRTLITKIRQYCRSTPEQTTIYRKEYGLHRLLECFWGRLQSIRHAHESIQFVIENKICFVAIGFSDLIQHMNAVSVQVGEHGSPPRDSIHLFMWGTKYKFLLLTVCSTWYRLRRVPVRLFFWGKHYEHKSFSLSWFDDFL